MFSFYIKYKYFRIWEKFPVYVQNVLQLVTRQLFVKICWYFNETFRILTLAKATGVSAHLYWSDTVQHKVFTNWSNFLWYNNQLISICFQHATTPPIAKPPTYQVKPVLPPDHENVIDFLRRFFFRDEPLNVSVNLVDSEELTCSALEQFSRETLNEDLSLMAVSSSGRLVGVCLSGIINRGEKMTGGEVDDRKFSTILTFLKDVDERMNIFEKYGELDEILCMKILSVDNAWRGRGIGRELLDETRWVLFQFRVFIHSFPIKIFQFYTVADGLWSHPAI